MDIGSGLTVETRTVNGKIQTGVFLSGNLGRNTRNKTKPKYPIRSKVDPDEKPKNGPIQNGKETITNVTAKTQRQPQKNRRERTGSGKNPSSVTKKVSNAPDTTKGNKTVGQDSEKGGNMKNATAKTTPPSKRGVTKSKGKENADADSPTAQEVDTKYVTLTQGQLNTILSLVKTKNEIDVSGVLEGKGQESKADEVKGQSGEENEEEGTLEGSADEKDKSRPTSSKSASEKVEKAESIANLLNGKAKKSQKGSNERKNGSRPSSKKSQATRGHKDVGSVKNDGKRNSEGISSKVSDNMSRESSNLEDQQPNPGRESQENLPAAIRSSFFLGEAAPREHAFSAKKREEQQRWREELDKQRIEQQQKKEREKDSRLKLEELDSWTRHFDTMLPTKKSPRLAPNVSQSDDTTIEESSTSGSITNKNNNNSALTSTGMSSKVPLAPIPSGGGSNQGSDDITENQDFASTMTNNAVPQRSTYLRTMTSLLDPAQIEALEVKRRKQEEHRKAIEAQVQERRRKKEEEEERRRRFEAEEDLRLAADRDSIAQKTELEKLRLQMQENLREQKTRELYQQMKNAEESALRDKLSRREQILKNKGHDTSRLERTHQMTLEMNHKVVEDQPLAQASQTSIMSNSSLPMIRPPQDGYVSNNLTPRQAFGVVGQSAPVAVTAQTEQGPIKLEISLNQKRASELVESAVQTDNRITEPKTLTFDSDAETEYLQLPQKQRNTRPREKNKKLQNFEKDLEHQYDRHSRTERNIPPGQQRQKKNGPRPKWGVGEKNKSFVPASRRYTNEQQKHDAVFRKREERNNVVSDPERSKARGHADNRRNPPETRPKSPPVPAVGNRQRNETKRQTVRDRPNSGIYATSEQAKYRSEKHSRDSPVPETKDFVQYRRTVAVLDPNHPQSRPETGPMESRTEFIQRQDRMLPAGPGDGDPLLNPDMVRQHERQEQILKEISILRQGLLIKQREVASYPAAMTHSMAVLPPTGAAPTNLILAGGGNLPERTNDTPVM